MPPRIRLALLPWLLVLLGAAWSKCGFAQDGGLLQATQAFALSARIDTPGTLHLHWTIAPHYYLYRSRIHVQTQDANVHLGELSLPDGLKKHDPYLGDVEVYHDALDASVSYSGGGNRLPVAVTFQGCHEIDPKICYPPVTQKLDLPLPTAPAAAPPATAKKPSTVVQVWHPGAASASGRGEHVIAWIPPGNNAKRGGLVGMPNLRAGVPLPPEQAFVLDAIARSPTELLLRWTMPHGYYLYRDQTGIALEGPPLSTLGAPRWPSGVLHEDANFGRSVVYFDEVDLPVPLQRASPDAREATLRVSFQGCQDGGLCYPVMTRELHIPLPAASMQQLQAMRGAVAAAAGTAPPLMVHPAQVRAGGPGLKAQPAQSDEQKLAGSLHAHGFAALAVFFGAGLLLAFTPCVLPMIPILSGLIVGAGEKISTARAFALSLTYVLASCVVFTVLGIVAGLAGANLSAWMQRPAILIAFALLFVALALAMFGVYSLQLPSSWQTKLANLSNRQRGGSFTGVAVMGVLSALIVGPCVAPPLAGAVLYIGQSHDAVFGGAALFALSFGMGVPLLVIGTAAGKLLPRAGAWMNAVKVVFGLMFLAVAIWLLSRVLDMRWILAMTGALLIGCAVWLGAASRGAWRRAGQALGVIALVIGACELLGAAAGSRDLVMPLAGLLHGKAASAQTLDFRRVKNIDEVDRAIAAASAAGKPAILDFYADWCVSCKEMEALTFTKPQVQQALGDYVLLRADVTANDAADQALLKRYGLFGPPATLFFGHDGHEQRALRLIGYEDAGRFLARLHKAAP